MGERRNIYKILVGKPERKRLLGKPRRRWDHNIRTNLRETWLEVVNWIHLAQYRAQGRAVVITVMNLRVP
jgi:hypothetical protein